jgi:hypothetical protein
LRAEEENRKNWQEISKKKEEDNQQVRKTIIELEKQVKAE